MLNSHALSLFPLEVCNEYDHSSTQLRSELLLDFLLDELQP